MVYCLVLTSDTAIGLSCCDEQAEAERYSMRAFSEKNRKSRATQAAEGVARSLAAVDVLACLLAQAAILTSTRNMEASLPSGH